MAITPAELATVRYVDYDYWVELSGGTCLAIDAAPRIRAGVAPFGVSSEWALGMAQAVADGARFPPLILITTGPSGALVVLEGQARLTAYMLCPHRLPPELEVLVGSSPGARLAGVACSSRLIKIQLPQLDAACKISLAATHHCSRSSPASTTPVALAPLPKPST
jgi:hypothetical protein